MKSQVYDYRRYITLVQVLALDSEAPIRDLCRKWGLEPIEVRFKLDTVATIRMLAKYVIRHQRGEVR